MGLPALKGPPARGRGRPWGARRCGGPGGAGVLGDEELLGEGGTRRWVRARQRGRLGAEWGLQMGDSALRDAPAAALSPAARRVPVRGRAGAGGRGGAASGV